MLRLQKYKNWWRDGVIITILCDNTNTDGMGRFVNDFFMICGYIDGRRIKSGF